MDFTDQQVTEKVAAFEKEQDPTLVYEALDLIEAAERSVPAEDTAARKQALSRRLRFLQFWIGVLIRRGIPRICQ